MLETVITYPTLSGDTKTAKLLPSQNYILVPDIAASGTITHYSIYKPEENAIDIFNATPVTVTF